METLSYQKAKDQMTIRRSHISIITLNVNALNSPTKRHRVAEWIEKQNPTICCSRRHISAPKTNRDSKGKGGK